MPTKEWFDEQKKEAVKWAYDTLQKEFYVLDTETASLKGEIVQLGLINHKGEVCINQLVKPKGKIDPGAEAVHHISLEMVKDAPTWDQIYPKVKELIEGKLVIAYNVGYDKPVVKLTGDLYGLPEITATWECAMENFARFNGPPGWSDYYGSFKWLKLTEAIKSFKLSVDNAHDATGDVLMTLQVIKEMSKYHPVEKLELY
jgi:DNA polymerase III epsilon subunit-like protein